MKKILALDQGEYFGGAELFFSDLLTKAADDFEIHLITGQNPAYHQLYKHSSVILHPMELPALKPIGLKSYRKYRQAQKDILKKMKEIQPHKIVSNTVRTHLLVSVLAKKKHIPLVWMAHDLTFSGLFMKWLKNCPQTLVSCSKFVESYYLERLGEREPLRAEVIYPFALELDQMQAYRGIKKEKVIGMVGKLIPWKGQDLLLHMAHKIHQAHPEYRFELIAGVYENNPESVAFHQECLRLIRTLKLEKVVQVRTFVPDIFTEMSRWEIFVHASREPEALGRVILEAMANGCAVVVSDLGGPKEVVKSKENGLLAKPAVEEIFKAVQWYIQRPEERKRMSEMARKETAEAYLWPKVMQQFKMVLEAA